MIFEFDEAKSVANLAKHGIDFVDAQRLWDDPRAFQSPTSYLPELRSLLTAMWRRRYWTAVFTMRAGNVRIISVRRSRKEESDAYEKG